MTCDWGDCGLPAAGWRWHPRPPGWAPLLVPVCRIHEPMELEAAA